VGAYHLVTAGKDKKYGTRDDKVIPLQSATYSAGSQTVTLATRRKARNLAAQLVITAALVRDAHGQLLDGNGDGQPGGDSRTTLGGKVRVRSQTAGGPGAELAGRVSAAAVDALLIEGQLGRDDGATPW
jgi:hypothetical protein